MLALETTPPEDVPPRADVLVIGGGTAGSVAARLLASWGHFVVVAERELSRPPLAESLPPSCMPLLERVGLRDEVEGAGFLRGTGNTVWWGGEPMRVERFAGGRVGLQVRRDRLEWLLADSAARAGVHRLHPATVIQVAPHDAGGYRVELSRPLGRTAIVARWVLDCSGRAGVAARRWREPPAAGVRTVALIAPWTRAGAWGVPDESHTLVESAPWGWGWSVPVAEGERYFTAMLDPGATPLRGAAQVAARYGELMRSLPALGALLDGAERSAAPWACEATPYGAREVAADGLLLVGDAASMLDPLSSFGVKKALSSAWLASVAVHTAFALPANLPHALALYRERERGYVEGAERTLGVLSREAAAAGAAFWQARAADVSDEGERATDDHVAEQLRDDAAVHAAFAELRARPSTRLVALAGAGRPVLPVVRGNVVVPEEHLQVAGLRRPVRYLRNVDLITLLDLAGRLDDAGAVYVAYARQCGPVPLPDLLGALSVLVGKGVAGFA